MKIVQAANRVNQTKEFPGLFRCEFQHTVSASSAEMTWTGPRFPKDMWYQIVSFFQWTYDDQHSESQVRLFVNLKTRLWAAWAFPQQERTGMSALELPDEKEWKEQRARFKEDEGWMYYGTVHHHCNAGAFQSGVDLANEEDQDGIHITVGNMDKDQHDIHARFYLCKFKFEPNMDLFWDIGDILKGVPDELIALLPQNFRDVIARNQMGRKIIIEFPKEWRDNVRPPTRTYQGGTSVTQFPGTKYCPGLIQPWQMPRSERITESVRRLRSMILPTRFTDADLLATIHEITQNGTMFSIFHAVIKENKFKSFDDVELKKPSKKASDALQELQKGPHAQLCDYMMEVIGIYDVTLGELRDKLKEREREQNVVSDFGYGYSCD